MSYDTDDLQFPVELPGGIMTERDDFWAQFGPARHDRSLPETDYLRHIQTAFCETISSAESAQGYLWAFG